MNMEVGTFNMFIESMNIIEAQENLTQYNAHDWPNLKRQDRSARHRKLHAIAYPRAWQQSKQMSGEEMAKVIKGLIGG